MATVASPCSLRFSHPFSCSLTPNKLGSEKPLGNLCRRASSDPETNDTSSSPPESDNFDSRLAQVRLRYRSGTGKKAEVRKGRKPFKKGSGGGGVFLPPIPLREPVSGGMKVEFGFTPYTERINGRLAGLGLSALLLVELGSGKSLFTYHSPPILFLQLYFVAALSAVLIKFEKETPSFWPQSSTTPPPQNPST